MNDWIVGLRKAAADARPGVSAQLLQELEAGVGQTLPDALRELYGEMDGGRFDAQVTLFSVRPPREADGLSEANRGTAAGAPRHGGTWEFGRRGTQDSLFASQKRKLESRVAAKRMPDWIHKLRSDEWVYGIHAAETGEFFLFPTLGDLLTSLVPPATTEIFGENTFSRALIAVEGAMEDLDSTPMPPTRETPGRGESEKVTPLRSKKSEG